MAQAQNDLSYYIQRWKYKAVDAPNKKTALYDLGVKLFNDPALSGKNNISCQSCHSREGFSGDAIPLGLGEGATGLGSKRLQKTGLVLARHTPALYNLGLSGFNDLFWDGRVAKDNSGEWQSPEPKLNGTRPELLQIATTLDSALAVQSIFPLTSPEEMLGKNSTLTKIEAWNQVMQTILKSDAYKKLFKEAYPLAKDYNIGHVGNALAEAVRHQFLATNTPWDLYLRGKKDALSERMIKGAVLFHSRANCIFCHNGNHFTNQSFENIGIPQLGADDKGRFQITKNPRDMYQFRVAPLRNVGVTAPYMHSGVFQTLEEVVDHYADPVISLRSFKWNARFPNYRDTLKLDTDSTHNDTKEKTLSAMLARKLTLNDEEKKDLICFVAVALTDMSLQKELIKKGTVNEISNCTPNAL
jgi:cytochrome c peroxidase